jgi:hypothetical protein
MDKDDMDAMDDLRDTIDTLTAERDALAAQLETAKRERDSFQRVGKHYESVLFKAANMLNPDGSGRTGALVVLSDLPKLVSERDALQERLKRSCEDCAEDDTAIRNALRPILGADIVDGNTHGVPGIVDLVDALAARVRELEQHIALIENGLANAH